VALDGSATTCGFTDAVINVGAVAGGVVVMVGVAKTIVAGGVVAVAGAGNETDAARASGVGAGETARAPLDNAPAGNATGGGTGGPWIGGTPGAGPTLELGLKANGGL